MPGSIQVDIRNYAYIFSKLLKDKCELLWEHKIPRSLDTLLVHTTHRFFFMNLHCVFMRKRGGRTRIQRNPLSVVQAWKRGAATTVGMVWSPMQNLLSYRIKVIKYWDRGSKLRWLPPGHKWRLTPDRGKVKEVSFYFWRRGKKEAWAQIIRGILL